jgi:hypothetical protein
MIVKEVNFDRSKITAMYRSGDYLWIAFQGTAGTCTLQKVSIYDPSDIYFSISITANSIIAMQSYWDTMCCVLSDATYLFVVVDEANPLGAATYVNRPTGETHEPSSVIYSVDFLAIGMNLTATPSKVHFYSPDDYSFISTLELSESGDEVYNISSIASSDSDTLWLGTNTAPANLVRVDSKTTYAITSLE